MKRSGGIFVGDRDLCLGARVCCWLSGVAGFPTGVPVIKPEGTVSLEWIKVTGAGFTGVSGITNAYGVLQRLQLTRNSTNPGAVGEIGSE